ncbi:MAG TPA: HepT-like ribonuclease domain-containing protein [Desulfobaccales bacterium]
MAKDDLVRLRHMLDSATEAVELIKGKYRADLDTNRVVSLALVRLLEILGEAANKVTTAAREQNPNIPWPQIISLRNRLIHGYDTINLRYSLENPDRRPAGPHHSTEENYKEFGVKTGTFPSPSDC